MSQNGGLLNNAFRHVNKEPEGFHLIEVKQVILPRPYFVYFVVLPVLYTFIYIFSCPGALECKKSLRRSTPSIVPGLKSDLSHQ